MSKRALIVVDVQKDFTEGGSLAVEGGAKAAEDIAAYYKENKLFYDTVVFTKDYHVDPGSHFSSDPDFKDSWPAHCVVGTAGSDFHPNLSMPINNELIFYKGKDTAAYSGFEGQNEQGKTLSQYFEEAGVDEVVVVGIALDYCVKATALDAVKYGFKTTVLKDLTAAVSDEGADTTIEEFDKAGVDIL